MTSHAVLADIPIVRDAVESPVAFQLKQFPWKGESWIGAYAAVGIGGLKVVSQIPESEAFRAARRLIEKSLLFGAIVITLALLLSGWLARSFTYPLATLVGATEKLSRWEFGESIRVKTNDEIGSLARAFNSMAVDLQRQHAEIDRHSKELELKVKERTAQLESEKKQAAEAQDALLRTTRLASLGELAGAAAHEILNPVNNMNIRIERARSQSTDRREADLKLLREIIGGWKKAYAEGGWQKLETELKKPAQGGKSLIEEDLENLQAIANDEAKAVGENRENLDFLNKEIVRVTRIVNNMRALSRVGGERKPLDVHGPIEDTIITLTDLMEKRKVTLIREYSPETRSQFTVIADKDELVQVFSNLIRNSLHAIDSANRRAGTVRISTLRNDDRVEVRISDNGTGISPSNLGRMFEPRFTTKSVEEGTGLGLSISRRLVRAFGGDIEIETSREGEGSTFLVWFPAPNS
jgi:signal transduction histidine kinase